MARMRRLPIVTLIITIGVLIGLGFTPHANTQPNHPSVHFGIAYPPINNVLTRAFTATHLKALNIRYIRFSVHWSLIETTPGVYNWDAFDTLMAWVAANDLNALLTIEANGPDWVCGHPRTEDHCVIADHTALAQFVTALLSRYVGSIAFIQFGNEVLSPDFYPGSIQDYVAEQRVVFDSVRAVTDEIPVVLAGFSSGVIRRFAACAMHADIPLFQQTLTLTGPDRTAYCQQAWVRDELRRLRDMVSNARYDIVDLHLYNDVEYWPTQYAAARAALGTVPMIVSEFGGPLVGGCDANMQDCRLGPTETQDVYTDAYHAERVALYMETLRDFDILLALYFKMVETGDPNHSYGRSGLFNRRTLEPKPAYDVFQRINTSH